MRTHTGVVVVPTGVVVQPQLSAEYPGPRPGVSTNALFTPATTDRELDSGATLETAAARLDHWRRVNAYYHRKVTSYLRFAVPEGESVLFIGCEDGASLAALKPSRGVGVDRRSEMIELARGRHGSFEYVHASYDSFQIDEQFEYLVLNDIPNEVDDIQAFLQKLLPLCTPTTRLVILQHNYLWRPILRLAARLGLKCPESPPNWLSAGDLETFLYAAGFETVALRRKLFVPRHLLYVGELVNRIMGVLPFLSRLASTEILIARPSPGLRPPDYRSCTIVLTTRDECSNIEPMVRAIPKVGEHTEILFVEGHSVDGTREEIKRVAAAYPDKNIRLVVQDGIGQGDAIREGFKQAQGDVVILLEADQTSPAEDVLKVWELISTGRADFVNGTRAVYPMTPGAMPPVNRLGNLLFAVWFTWFLGQRTTDVLCGIKGISKRQFQKLERNWGFLGLFDPFGDFELLFGASRLGLQICEVPTRYRPRVYGQTKSRVLSHGWILARMAARATGVFKCR